MKSGDRRWDWNKSRLQGLVVAVLLCTGVSLFSLGLAQGAQIKIQVYDMGNNPMLPSALLYRAGTGDWQTLELPVVPPNLTFSVTTFSREETLLTFTLPEGETRYEVAVACVLPALLASHTLYALTTEVVSLEVPCLEATPLYPTATIGGRIGYSSDNDLSFDVYTQVGSDRVVDTSNGYSVVAEAGDAQDLVVLAATPSAMFGPGPEVQAGRVVHDLTVLEDYSDVDLLLGEEDAVTERQALAVPAVPDGYSPGLQAFFMSREGIAPSISVARTEYPVLPGTAAGDRYIGVGLGRSEDKLNSLMHLKLADAPEAFDFTLPPPWPPYSLGPAPQPVFRDLTHLRDDPELRAYQIDLFDNHIRALVSPAYLGDETSYALPDFTGLAGFEGFQPQSQYWRLSAVLADQPLAVLLSSQTVTLEIGASIFTFYSHDNLLQLADLPHLNLRIASVNSEPAPF